MSMVICIRKCTNDFLNGLITLNTDEEVSDYIGGYRYATDNGRICKPGSLAWRIGNENGFGALNVIDQENEE